MKKLFSLVLILCLLMPCASAEKLKDFIAAYSEIAPVYSAPTISSASLQNINGTRVWKFDSGAMLIVLLDAKMNLSGVAVTGTEDNVGDFLAASVCSIVAMDEDEDINKIFQRVMEIYLDWRDQKADFSVSYVTQKNKIGVTLQYGSGLYQMVIGHTGL